MKIKTIFILLISCIIIFSCSKSQQTVSENTDVSKHEPVVRNIKLPAPDEPTNSLITNLGDNILLAVQVNKMDSFIKLLKCFPQNSFLNNPEVKEFYKYLDDYEKKLIKQKLLSGDMSKTSNEIEKFISVIKKGKLTAALYVKDNIMNPKFVIELDDLDLSFEEFYNTYYGYMENSGFSITKLDSKNYKGTFQGESFNIYSDDKLWLITETVKDKNYLLNLKNKDGSLYKDALAEIKYRQGINFFVNLNSIVEKTKSMTRPDEQQIFDILKLQDLKYVYGATDIENVKPIIKLRLKVKDWNKHPLKPLFAQAGLTFNDLSGINSPADMIIGIKYNFDQAYTQIINLAATISEKVNNRKIDINAVAQQVSGIDIKNDIIKNLGNKMTLSFSYPLFQHFYAGSLCAAIDLKPDNNFNQSLKLLFNALNIIKEPAKLHMINTEYKNYKFSYLLTKNFPFITPSVMVHNNKLYLTLFVQHMKSVIYFLENPRPVTKQPEFVKFKNEFKQNTACFGMIDMRLSSAAILEFFSYLASVINFEDAQREIVGRNKARNFPIFDIAKIPTVFELAKNWQPFTFKFKNLDDGIEYSSDINIFSAMVPVISVAGIWSAIAIPKLVTAVDKAKGGAVYADMAAMNSAIQIYLLDKNELPTTLNKLSPDYIGQIPKNPWGKRYYYIKQNADDYILYTYTNRGKKIIFDSNIGKFSEK